MAKRSLLGFFQIPAKTNTPSDLLVAGDSCRYDYLQLSRRFYAAPGFHDLDIEINVIAGGVTIGLLDTRGAWRGSINISKSGRYQLCVGIFWPVALTRVVIAACNINAPGPVNAAVTRLTIDSWLFRPTSISGALRRVSEQLGKRVKNAYRTRLVPQANKILICSMAAAGRLGLSLRHLPLIGKLVQGYHVIDTATIGYASRGITSLSTSSGLFLMTADVGDDTLSVLPIKNGRLQTRATVTCPTRSAPMYVSRLKFPEGDRSIVSLFNFDETGRVFPETSVGLINNLPAAIHNGLISSSTGLQPLIRRSGYWGFRGSAVHQLADGRYRLASVDRDRNLFYLLDSSTNGEAPRPTQLLDLGPTNEPIGINFAPPLLGHLPTDYYLSCRKAAEIIHVQVSPEGKPQIKSRYSAPGLSRSSVAIGRTRFDQSWEVLVAQWGGDPTDLNGSGQGSFVVLPIGQNGQLGKALHVLAGINPTDIIAGDLDGDGIDEVVVLNYGNGLGIIDRTNFGNVSIYKWDGLEYVRKAVISLPSPRIGMIFDIDDDGQLELLVTTFYERRLVVIKYFGD